MYSTWQDAVRAITHEREDNCCTVVATAIACNVRFSKARRVLAKLSNRKRNRGVPFARTHDAVFSELGYRLKQVWDCNAPTMITMERWANRPENKDKVFLVYVREHVCTIRKGQVVDHSKGSRRNIKAVYEVLPLTEEI